MSWPTKKLGDCLVQFDRGISWSRKDEGGTIAVLRIPNIQEGHINLKDLKYINTKSKNGELEKDDIVMVASNGNPDSVGRSALVAEKEKGMRFASFLIRLRFDNTKLLSQYAHLFLLTPIFKRELRRKIATTSGIYNLKKGHIEKIKIPLPPPNIQKQIIERLDKIVKAQKLNNGLIQGSDELFQSLLYRELSSVGKNWEIKKFKEIFEPSESGKVGSQQNTPIMSITMGFGLIDQSEKFRERVASRDIANYKRVEKGELVIGFPIDEGVLGFQKKYNYAAVSPAYGVWKIKDKDTEQDFLEFFLQSDLARSIYKARMVWTTERRRFIPKKQFLAIPIPFPKKQTQKQIVAKLSAAQDYKTQLLAQKSKLKELFDSVLSKSFSGNL